MPNAKRWHMPWMAIVLAAIAVVGCGARGGMGVSEEAPMAEEEAVWSGAAPAEPASAPHDDVSLEAVDRMIIYTGELSLVVRDTERAMEEAISIAEDVGGYLSDASSNTYGDGLRRINLTLRVPAEAFNETMDALRGLALEVTGDSVASEDVTQEYVDLESRLTALEVKADRLEELMEEAEDTEAVLAVYEELSETQIEIEETKGRMRYLERRSAMATITVYLTPDELARPVEVAGWRPQGTAKRAIEALIRAFQFLVDALIWILLVFVPIFGFIGLLVYVLIRILRAVFGRRRSKADVAPAREAEVDSPDAK
ncbi:MAG: DUF4349 domain-containing protein [Anaerolineae bacterium]|nr:DUF4349 domain-containing protein [Anaerolineae bacterium]